MYTLLHQDAHSNARRGRLHFPPSRRAERGYSRYGRIARVYARWNAIAELSHV